jgi:hypothetical protein
MEMSGCSRYSLSSTKTRFFWSSLRGMIPCTESPASRTLPYLGLDLNKAQCDVRLLTLLPGDTDDHIESTLRRVSLNNEPKYEALSYAWGNGSEREEILVNNTVMSVTRSLYVALAYLRRSDQCRTLWIDALCINQSNVPERNQQVGMMGEIYASATQVLVWLGEEDQIREITGWAVEQMKSSREELMTFDKTMMKRIGAEVYWLQERPWFR